MARKAMIEKEKRRKAAVERGFAKRQELKKIIKSWTVSEEEKTAAMHKLTSLPRDTARIRLRNRCQLTGRPRGYYRKFGVSRLAFRELSLAGLIPGMVKASW